jgi:hypothetical protein
MLVRAPSAARTCEHSHTAGVCMSRAPAPYLMIISVCFMLHGFFFCVIVDSGAHLDSLCASHATGGIKAQSRLVVCFL